MKKPLFKRKWFIALVIIVLLGLIGGCMGGGEDEPATEPTATEATQSEETTTEATTEAVPQEYQNALKKADTYVNMMYMSKAGVYDQLTSEYGEGFDKDAAQYAVDNLDVDWNYIALQKAKSYYEDMAMSKSAVYDQLVSKYGEQFTKDQAQYAVDHLDD